jgi:hypothetical protein
VAKKMARPDIWKDGVETRFKPQGELPPGARLAKKPLAVKVLEEEDAAIRALPEQAAWLRRVIVEAARRELLSQSQRGTVSENATPPPDNPPLRAATSPRTGAKAKKTMARRKK